MQRESLHDTLTTEVFVSTDYLVTFVLTPAFVLYHDTPVGYHTSCADLFVLRLFYLTWLKIWLLSAKLVDFCCSACFSWRGYGVAKGPRVHSGGSTLLLVIADDVLAGKWFVCLFCSSFVLEQWL